MINMIFVNPADVFEVAWSNPSGELTRVATNGDDSISVFVIGNGENASIVVCRYGDPVFSSSLSRDPFLCMMQAQSVYLRFLNSEYNGFSDVEFPDDDVPFEYDFEPTDSDFYGVWLGEDDFTSMDEVIEIRENDLTSAAMDFLSVVLDGNTDVFRDGFKEVIDDFKDIVLRLVGERYGFEVYRPTIMQDSNGDFCLVEYPYN